MRLGVDFGTSNTKLGFISDEQFVNLAAESNTIPSVVTYSPLRQKLYFGHLAVRLDEPGAYSAYLFKLALKRNHNYFLGPFGLEEILAKFFAFLQETYVKPDYGSISSVILSVPNYFGLNSRNILLKSAKRGFRVDQIELLLEPVAGFLGFTGNYQGKINGDILCIDIGGGTTDFSFLSVSDDQNDIILETQLQIGNDAFSGSEIDRGILYNILLPAFKIQTGLELPFNILIEKRAFSKERYLFNQLMRTAEKIKIELCQTGTLMVDLPDFYFGQSLLFPLDSERFKSQLSSIFDRFRIYFNQNIKNKAMQLGLYTEASWHLDYILLLGGASQTLGLQELINELCPDTPIIFPDDPYFKVVKGLCAAKSNSLKNINIKSIYPFDFCIEQKQVAKENILSKIPFDTGNLPLNIYEKYRIFSFSTDSVYNLAEEPDSVKLKIFEVTDEDDDISLQKFSGQEIVLQTDLWFDKLQPSIANVYLNLSECKLELELSANLQHSEPAKANTLDRLYARQESALDLVKAYKLHNPKLLQDYSKHLHKTASKTEKPYENHLETTFYKVLALLQFLNGK